MSVGGVTLKKHFGSWISWFNKIFYNFAIFFQTLAVQPCARASKQQVKERDLSPSLLKSNAAITTTVYECMFQHFHGSCFFLFFLNPL